MRDDPHGGSGAAIPAFCRAGERPALDTASGLNVNVTSMSSIHRKHQNTLCMQQGTVRIGGRDSRERPAPLAKACNARNRNPHHGYPAPSCRVCMDGLARRTGVLSGVTAGHAPSRGATPWLRLSGGRQTDGLSAMGRNLPYAMRLDDKSAVGIEGSGLLPSSSKLTEASARLGCVSSRLSQPFRPEKTEGAGAHLSVLNEPSWKRARAHGFRHGLCAWNDAVLQPAMLAKTGSCSPVVKALCRLTPGPRRFTKHIYGTGMQAHSSSRLYADTQRPASGPRNFVKTAKASDTAGFRPRPYLFRKFAELARAVTFPPQQIPQLVAVRAIP